MNKYVIIKITNGKQGSQKKLFKFYSSWLEILYKEIPKMRTSKVLDTVDVRYNQFIGNLNKFYNDKYLKYCDVAKTISKKDDMALAQFVADLGVECKAFYKDYFYLIQENRLVEDYNKQKKNKKLDLANVGQFVNSYHV